VGVEGTRGIECGYAIELEPEREKNGNGLKMNIKTAQLRFIQGKKFKSLK